MAHERTSFVMSSWLSALNRSVQWSLLLGAALWLFVTSTIAASAIPPLTDRLELALVVLGIGLPGSLNVARWLAPKNYSRHLRVVCGLSALLAMLALVMQLPTALAAAVGAPIGSGLWFLTVRGVQRIIRFCAR